MSERALDDAAQLLSRRVGLRLDPSLRGRLVRAVRDEAARLDQDIAAYVASLERDDEALQLLLNRVTVQETAFFRDRAQFRALADVVLPELRTAGGPVRVWSAAAANGQEPYTMAMVLDEAGIDDWTVIATDVSTSALQRTRAGRYAAKEISGLSEDRRQRYLTRSGDQWEVIPRLRERVQVSRHNLVAEPPPFSPGTCQIVLCRNVLIYFNHEEVVALLDRLATWMPRGGYLFLGYSESLWQVSNRFSLVRVGDAFVYRNVPEASSAAPRPRPVASPPKAPVPRPPRPRPAPPRPEPAAEAPPGFADLLADGERALGAADYPAAINAFRQAAYLDPDHPLAHLNLGLALESVDDAPAAQRAYRAARAALDRGDVAAVEAMLEGYRLEELIRLLDTKTGRQ